MKRMFLNYIAVCSDIRFFYTLACLRRGETENEKITFNLEYFINNNNGNLPAKIHILERYGVENADKNPTPSDDSNGGGGITRSHMIKISCDEDFVSKEDGQLIYDASTKVLGKTENGTYLVIGALLGKNLKIAKSDISIVSGELDRYKKILINSSDDKISDKLKALMPKE